MNDGGGGSRLDIRREVVGEGSTGRDCSMLGQEQSVEEEADVGMVPPLKWLRSMSGDLYSLYLLGLRLMQTPLSAAVLLLPAIPEQGAGEGGRIKCTRWKVGL